MIKILHLTTDSRIGGTEKNIISLVTRLDRDKYDNVVISLMPKGEMQAKLNNYGIVAESLDMVNKFDFRAVLKLFRILKDKKIDILHTYLFHANIIGRIAGRLARVPVIISSIRVMEKRRYHLWLDRLTSSLVDVETCVSESVRKFTVEKAGIRPEKLVAILNGIECGEYEMTIDVQAKKRELGIEQNFPVLGTVGRLHEQKGQVYLLKAMPAILEKYPRAVLLVAGEGPLRKKLEILCTKLHINNTVRFLGLRKDIKELMSLMDIFILPSLWEGMPNALMEAMALGKPIVATSIGGIEELVRNEITGLLIPPFDEKALAETVIRILTREDSGRELGEAAKIDIEKKFPLECMVKETEQLYKKLLEER